MIEYFLLFNMVERILILCKLGDNGLRYDVLVWKSFVRICGFNFFLKLAVLMSYCGNKSPQYSIKTLIIIYFKTHIIEITWSNSLK